MSVQRDTLRDKVCLITGATSGIGEATLYGLASMGAELFAVCRNEEKGRELVAAVVQKYPGTKLSLLIGDLACLADVRRIANEFLATGKPLHVLINNAGVVNVKRKLSADGIEQNFAINHLAYFLLTDLLLDRLKESAPARIVSVASGAHAFVKGVNFEDIEYAHTPYKTFKVYGNSKLCNILWTRRLARNLAGSGVTANCVHPGAVRSGLGHQDHPLVGKIVGAITSPFFQSPEKGASTSLHLATSPGLENVSGQYFANCKPKRPKPWAEDDAAAERLWLVSEDYIRRHCPA